MPSILLDLVDELFKPHLDRVMTEAEWKERQKRRRWNAIKFAVCFWGSIFLVVSLIFGAGFAMGWWIFK
jgi:hypothetical protein